MLNAFRHHRGRHSSGAMRSLRGVVCAQRLSASQRSALARLRKSHDPQRVLNAFRHHRGRHARLAPIAVRASRCAQRLSASQRSAPVSEALRAVGRFRAQRLSASQRSAHPRPQIGQSASSRAQRLSASQRSARYGNGIVATVAEGAQRLSASQRSAQISERKPREHQSVLNAFRHHRGRHVAAPVVLGWGGTVLNAFRHHRGRHLTSADDPSELDLCSTPFGITEVGTSLSSLGSGR